MSQLNSLDPNGEIIDVGRGKPRRPRRWLLLVILAIAVLLFLFGSRGLAIYTSALWFGSLGYSAVFWYIFKLKLVLFLIFFALTLLAIPFLKLVGAILLVWIGVKLLAPEHDDAHGNITGSDKLWGAVKTVIVADLVMSVDNVIAIAGAAQGAGDSHQMPLVIFGLLVSIPIIVWGSQLVIKLMDRFPMIITLGGMLLGWIAGTMAVSDPALANTAAWTWVPKVPQTDVIKYAAGVFGALLVLVIGKWVASRHARNKHEEQAVTTG